MIWLYHQAALVAMVQTALQHRRSDNAVIFTMKTGSRIPGYYKSISLVILGSVFGPGCAQTHRLEECWKVEPNGP
jgi:hypothetical protein